MNHDITWYGGIDLGLGPGDIVLDFRHGDPAPPRKRVQEGPHFSAHFALARSPISVTAELLLWPPYLFLLSSPNLSRRRLDVALVRI